MRNELRGIAERLVEFGIIELTNNGQTYRVTPEGKEIVRLLLKESK